MPETSSKLYDLYMVVLIDRSSMLESRRDMTSGFPPSESGPRCCCCCCCCSRLSCSCCRRLCLCCSSFCLERWTSPWTHKLCCFLHVHIQHTHINTQRLKDKKNKGETSNRSFVMWSSKWDWQHTPLRSSAAGRWWIQDDKFGSKRWPQQQWTWSASIGNSQSECLCDLGPLFLKKTKVGCKGLQHSLYNLSASSKFFDWDKTKHSHLCSAQPQRRWYFHTHAESAWWWGQRVWSHPGRRGHGAQILHPQNACYHTTSCLNGPRLRRCFGKSMQNTPLVHAKDNLQTQSQALIHHGSK